jgi:hypothetical protein
MSRHMIWKLFLKLHNGFSWLWMWFRIIRRWVLRSWQWIDSFSVWFRGSCDSLILYYVILRMFSSNWRRFSNINTIRRRRPYGISWYWLWWRGLWSRWMWFWLRRSFICWFILEINCKKVFII